MMRRALATTACGAFALGGAVAAPAASADPSDAPATTVVATVHCTGGTGHGDATGTQDVTVSLSPATAAPGQTVTATVTEGPGPLAGTLTKPAVPTTPSLDLAMSGGATGTVTVTGAVADVDLTQGYAVLPPTFTGTFTLPPTATGTVAFSPLRTVTSTDLGGYPAVADCDVTGAPGAVAYVAVAGASAAPAPRPPTAQNAPAPPTASAKAATAPPTTAPTPAPVVQPLSATEAVPGAAGQQPPPGAGTLTRAAATDVPQQGLSMSQSASGIDFGSVTMDGTAKTLTANLDAVTVTDTRGGNLGWTLTARLSNLAAVSGPGTIPAGAVSWTPQCTAAASSASTVATGAAGPLSATTPSVLCSQAADAAHPTGGQFTADAALTLTTPEFAQAGDYTGTLTLSLS